MFLQPLPVIASENKVAATHLIVARVTGLNFRAPIITKSGYYNLPICYSRTIAYFSKNAMLFNRRRFSAEHFIDSFGGGIR
jgi:hypothetical protein